MTPAMLLAVLLAAPAPAPVPPANVPVGPNITARWLTRPRGDQFAAFAPAEAVTRGIDGGAVIACVADDKGRMEQCRVVFEAPEGLGFGAAALHLAPAFRVEARTSSGAIAHPTMTIPISWHFGGRLTASETFLVAQPRWSSAPSYADVERAYLASANGVVGTITLRCRVNSAGRIGLCQNPDLEGAKGSATSSAERLTEVGQFLSDKFQLILNHPDLPAGTALMADVTFHFIDPKDPAFAGRQIGDPTWTATIAPGDIAKVFPPEAAAKGVTTGRGVAECTVGADGSLQACHPLAGTPDGLGFSEAAVKVASVMRMSLWTSSGGPVAGANVRLPIRFNLAAPAAGEPSKP